MLQVKREIEDMMRTHGIQVKDDADDENDDAIPAVALTKDTVDAMDFDTEVKATIYEMHAASASTP